MIPFDTKGTDRTTLANMRKDPQNISILFYIFTVEIQYYYSRIYKDRPHPPGLNKVSLFHYTYINLSVCVNFVEFPM